MSSAKRLAKKSLDERRSGQRYPVEQPVSYKVRNQNNVVAAGTGKTLNISSSGILVQIEDSVKRLDEGTQIELSVEWPCLLEGKQPLRLRIRGSVVRNSGIILAIRASECDFCVSVWTPATSQAFLAAAIGPNG